MAKNTAKGSSGQQGNETHEVSGVVSKAQELKVFFEEAQVELKNVTWPTPQGDHYDLRGGVDPCCGHVAVPGPR